MVGYILRVMDTTENGAELTVSKIMIISNNNNNNNNNTNTRVMLKLVIKQ
jgi:hypothetical protein